MQQMLVHIDQSLGPIGAWGYHDGDLTHYYPESLDTQISARARDAMAARDLDITVPEWFNHLANHSNALDDFQAIEVNDTMTLPSILSEFRRVWNNPTD